MLISFNEYIKVSDLKSKILSLHFKLFSLCLSETTLMSYFCFSLIYFLFMFDAILLSKGGKIARENTCEISARMVHVSKNNFLTSQISAGLSCFPCNVEHFLKM